jgi:hypothetical protein
MKKSTIFIVGVIVFILAFCVVVFNFQNQALPLNALTLYEKLVQATNDFKVLSVINHVLLILVILGGLFLMKERKILYALFMIYLCVCALICGFTNGIYLNCLYFPAVAGLTVHATISRKMRFDFKNLPLQDKIVGGIALVGSFWYLALVESPVYINALIYSPIGVVNCPTTLALCGFLILNSENGNRSRPLEFIVLCGALFFGGLGVLTMNVYYDIILVSAGLYITGRLWEESYVIKERSTMHFRISAL